MTIGELRSAANCGATVVLLTVRRGGHLHKQDVPPVCERSRGDDYTALGISQALVLQLRSHVLLLLRVFDVCST